MRDPASLPPVLDVVADLERRLKQAKAEKAFAEVPALRRLRWVVKILLTWSLIWQLFAIGNGFTLAMFHKELQKASSTDIQVAALELSALLSALNLALNWLLLLAFWRFLRQFRRAEVREIALTLARIKSTYGWNLGLVVVNGCILPFVIFRGDTATFAMILMQVRSLVLALVFYFVMRHYVKTAQLELPMLTGLQESADGFYRPWRLMFLVFMLVAVVVIGGGYLLGMDAYR